MREKAEEFLNLVKEKIHGQKIIAVCLEGEDIEQWDISSENKVGYDTLHELMLLTKLSRGLQSTAGIIIRQFLPLKVEVDTLSGKMYIPTKNLYGFFLCDGKWLGMSKEEVDEAENTNADTGQRLRKEDAVFYKDAPF